MHPRSLFSSSPLALLWYQESLDGQAEEWLGDWINAHSEKAKEY